MLEGHAHSGGTPLPVVTLGPTKRRLRLKDIWATRRVAGMIGLRDMRVKYKQAALGPLWLVIAPLGMLAALTIAFSGVTDPQTSGIPYLPFVLTGLTVWTFISASMSLGAAVITTNAPLVRRSPLPRIALLGGSMAGNLPPLGVLLAFSLTAAIAYGLLPIQALLLPFLIAWLMLFTYATLLLISPVAVKYRDTLAIVPLIIQAGIFVTPVGYGIDGAPSTIKTLLILNPATGLIEAWRWALLDLPDPSVAAIAIAGGWTVLLLIAGWRIFGRLEVGFADFV